MYETRNFGEYLGHEKSVALLNLCLKEATYFSLIEMPLIPMPKAEHLLDRRLETALKPFRVKRFVVKEGMWGCRCAEPSNSQEVRVQVFRNTPESKEILLQACQGIYLDYEETDENVTVGMFDDISFWDEKGLVLADTLAHEGLIIIYERNEALVEFAKKDMEYWEYTTGSVIGRNENLPFGGEYQELE